MGANQQLLLAGKPGLLPLSFSSAVVAVGTSSDWSMAAYNPTLGKFSLASNAARISVTSTDSAATSWSSSEATGCSSNLLGYCHQGNAFVAVSQNGGVGTGAARGGVGAGWAGETITATGAPWMWVGFDGTNTYAIPFTNSACQIYGLITPWSASGSLPTTGASWTSCVGFNTPSATTIVLPASGSSGAISTTSGVSWSTMTMPSAGAWWGGCNGTGNVGNSPRFVAVKNTSSVSAASSNGTSWTAGTLPASRSWCAVVWCANTWVAIAAGTNKCATSVDGLIWVEQTLAATTSAAPAPRLYGTNGQLTRCVVPLGSSSNCLVINTY